ncbi:MAG: hypothetical protein ACLFVJ_14830 [Persicimonas sp.]
MAHTTLDLSPRTTRRAEDDDSRSARFRRAEIPGEDTLEPTARRAAYRPREELAVRRDIVEDFRNRLERDATHTPDDEAAVAAALSGIARAEESLGRFDEARAALGRLANLRDLDADHLNLARRLHRRAGRTDRVLDTLDRAAEVSSDELAALLALEKGRGLWLAGAPADEVVSLGAQFEAAPGDYSRLWKMRLGVDALLEQGRREEAVALARRAVSYIEDDSLCDVLEARLAVWQAVWGDIAQAAESLEDVRRRTDLTPDLGEFLGSLYFELGDRKAAARLFVGMARSLRLDASAQMTAAMLEETVGGSPGEADRLLAALSERTPDDWTVLRARENHLERYIDRPEAISQPGEALIDVFNLQIEGPLSTQERVSKLTRLGRLYEREASLEEAAAEVYREALSLKPGHVPALRALGRLYSRRDNWAGLADLYEREIAEMAGAPSVWRRHFQVAEIYRVRLQNPPRALDHYTNVLEHRPHYLPALKAAAGLLGELGRWHELADLFLASVESAPNRRQKMYLLDKVAEVAENQLENFDVAIGAWQEILLLDDQHPRAFAALGRLYAQTDRWSDLIALNLREIELVEDAEEEAVLRQKCAEIAERHLGDLERAEAHYRAALDVLPDFLPALEGLGRIYMQTERWDDIIEMSGRELQQTDDLREAVRRLGALAEIFETRLDRREDAIRVYDRILELDPANAYALESAIRLNYTLERWHAVIALLEQKLALTNEARAFAALQGELGQIAEWHLGEFGQAFGRYLAALDAQPQNAHWLAGVARTWSQSTLSAEQVAARLEDSVVKPMPGEVRDDYFKVIARLRERATRSVDASRAHRMHGSSDSLENQLVLQLAMAQSGEREVLRQFRRANAQHDLERLLDIDRTGLGSRDVDAIRRALADLKPVERAQLLGELDVETAAQFVSVDDDPALQLCAELVRVLGGDELRGEKDQAIVDPLSLRLRGIEARQSDDFEAYVFWTRREVELRQSRDLKVSRLVEVAEFAAQRDKSDEAEQRDVFLTEAAKTAFPEMNTDDQSEHEAEKMAQGACDGPTLDRLYQAIRDAARWELLRDCLEIHAMREGLTSSRRLYLFRALAEVFEVQLDDYEGAANALSNCWQISEEPAYLRRLVEVSQHQGELDRATRFQQRHFEHLNEAGGVSDEDCVQSGLWLAELLLEDEERLEDGIDCLEHLIASFSDCALLVQARRKLAYAYFDLGNAYRSVELFQEVLGDGVSAEELDDWRKLVDVYRDNLDDLETAYALQWKINESGHGQERDLEDLVDLAFSADLLEDCATRLEELAEGQDKPRRLQLLWRAAQLVEEDLMLPEDAVRLYTEALELCDEGDEPWLELVRRRAFCLSQIAGREARALEEFRKLVAKEPFEPTTYRGLDNLLSKTQAHDRSRVARQILGVLNCSVDLQERRTKTEPSRVISREKIARHLLPEGLDESVLDVLQAAMPLVEKVWADELPQRKAFEGTRLDKLDAADASRSLEAALDVFGFGRFKAEAGDSGPYVPQVFGGGTPHVWLNSDSIEQMDPAELRFVAGYCAALAWSGLPALLTIDGRRVWHLIEAVQLKQTGEGFDERVDMATQKLVDPIASPFHAVARRRLSSAVEPMVEQFGQIHCEQWPRAVEQFACRVGLVLSGDVRAAVRGLLGFHGWELPLDAPETQKQIRRNKEVRSLLDYAMSDDYLEARYAFGLSGRPSKLVR